MATLKRLLVILIVLAAVSAQAATLVLKRAWIEKFKDRSTIDAALLIDKAHKSANSPKEDGDMHLAGRAAKEIGLPMVVELMNARDEKQARALIRDNEGKNTPVAVSGVWRVWFEHPPGGDVAQKQFDTVDPPTDTNPAHMFEIHPVTKLGTIDLVGTLRPINGFTPHPAAAAFGAYESKSLKLKATKSAVTLISTKVVFNYTKFVLRVTSNVTTLDDGGFALLADVGEEGGDEDDALATNVRMIFVPGSEPWKKVRDGVQAGDEMSVVGIPRLNLNAVSTAIATIGTAQITRKLPYEMIIVSLEEEEE